MEHEGDVMEYRIVKKDLMNYLFIPELKEMGLKHCFTMRTMDMGTHTNKSLQDRLNNFKSIYDFLEVKPKVLYNGYQVHSNNIAAIEDDTQAEEAPIGRIFKETDGLITNLPDVALITRFADCAPIILFDPVKKVQANIHSGWKGTLQEIAVVGIKRMNILYKSKPKDIIAVIGPSIDKDDFEVSEDVKILFENKFYFHKDIIRVKNKEKYLIDLQKTNKNILLDGGIKEENLTVVDISTYSDERFHSYRRDKDKFGLMGLITVL